MTQVLSSPLPEAPRPIAFSVIRVPFFLEPSYDESKLFEESNRERLVKKWGGPRGWEEQKLRHDLKGRGQQAGIPHFNLDRLAANTMASHRLIQHIGKTYGLHASEAVYDLLNVYYFVDGHSLNDKERLAKVVANELNGFLLRDDSFSSKIPSEEDILKFLNGQEGRKEIDLAVKTLSQLGIHGIPKFIIEGQTVIDGAAESSVFVEVFREIERRGYVENEPVFGKILGVPQEVVERGSHNADSLKKTQVQ